ncbi:MAG: 16S rRNA (guanine(527)-N(7))-methyltransferase RsmG [Ruminococcus sp.]|nr:16S rRNA (guanine(527)-N(7))-methyltransferase RsmG [Ruminococcus sp.]
MSEFNELLLSTLDEFNIVLDDEAIDRLCRYDDLLIAWNEKINLTALTAPEDVALKHFADSLMLLRYIEIKKGACVIDVGTGAGFPGLVLKIARPDIRLTLLDSLQKRLDFLDVVCREIGLEDVELIHSRAEDGSRTGLRDSFDIAVSRAVASLNTLCEYDMPYVRIGGRFIAMKGKEAGEELANAQNAVSALGGRLIAKHDFVLSAAGDRSIIEIEKITATPENYPRRSKAIQNKPL